MQTPLGSFANSGKYDENLPQDL
uniref:Uncharacterized protein n=1 Tax=Arundo donax TaxID=35708 RepID=A0A0A9BLC7_ARUDO